MTGRLTPHSEAYWRAIAAGDRAGAHARDAARELLAEIDALRAETPPQLERGHLEAMAANELCQVPGFAELPSHLRLECYARMGRLLAEARLFSEPTP